MNSKTILLFSFSSKEQKLPFFKDFRFTNNPTHKLLEFMFPLDAIDEHMQKIHADILFLEEGATIHENLFKTISNAEQIYLIYTNKSSKIKEKLEIITKGRIHRKIIDKGIETETAIQLITDMAQAYTGRDKDNYYNKLNQLTSIFTHNYLQEAQLQIMHASSSKESINEILTENDLENAKGLIIQKLLIKTKTKEILTRLASEDLTDTQALLKVRTQLHRKLFADSKALA